MLEQLTHYFEALDPGWLYLAFGISSFLENIFPPIPGDTVIVFAAYLVGRTGKNLVEVLIATTIGSTLGFMTFFLLGRLMPLEYFLSRDFRLLPAARIRQAGDWMQRYGLWIVLANRFLSGVRSVISITAGMYRLSWPRVLLLATVSAAVWNGLLLGSGYLLGSNWILIEEILRQYSRILLLVFLALGLILLLRRRSRKQQS